MTFLGLQLRARKLVVPNCAIPSSLARIRLALNSIEFFRSHEWAQKFERKSRQILDGFFVGENFYYVNLVHPKESCFSPPFAFCSEWARIFLYRREAIESARREREQVRLRAARKAGFWQLARASDSQRRRRVIYETLKAGSH